MNAFDIALALKGLPLRAATTELERLQRLPEREFAEWQLEKRNAICAHHRRKNPFYREFTAELAENCSWEELPRLEKSDLQAPLEERLSEGFSPSSVYKSSTSGSSGHPLVFAKDPFCHALSWALVRQRYALHGITPGAKEARFYGIPLEGIGNVVERLKDRVMNRRRFTVFDLSDERLGEFLEVFRREPFDYIYGYTRSVVIFAKYLVDRGIVLSSVCPSLNACIVTSEVCTQEDRDLMQTSFGIPIVNEYGCSETSILAFEYPDQTWRLSEETCYVEVDEGGEILVTALFNEAFPFIRYRIGDLGTLNDQERIEGKYRTLKNLDGRTNDTIELPSGKRSPGFTFYYVSRSLLEKSVALREFIIRQTDLDRFVFEVVADRDLRPEEIEEIRNQTAKHLEPGLRVEVKLVESIERPASGKIKHFYSEIE